MKYRIRHTYKPKIIIPSSGFVDNCLSFLISKEPRIIVTSDNVECAVTDVVEKHICDLESEIQSVYKCDVWSWIKRWYSLSESFNNMRVFVIELKKAC